MSSSVFNNLKSRLNPVTKKEIYPSILPPSVIQIKSSNGGPESSKRVFCPTCIVNSKVFPIQSSPPVVSVMSKPASITTQRLITTVLSAPLFDVTQRFAYILPPVIPPPDIIAFIPYRDTNEPASRIPPCVGPKRINT